MVVGWLVSLLSLFSKTEEQLMSKQKGKKKKTIKPCSTEAM
jgi:hypothetical protein